ncbi:uncharacterized protein LOC132019565 [Mustela nigripes]|uniref:uncharacterized protein LOC132019565 n=1 Tax=Mustela nigripes TaxID=77151 RepID=UPI0028165ABB|nr:uncharacterized protein LOC132019565 [Mustela nigripes]
MWLSVLATQKFRFPLLPQSDFHGDPRVPGGCPRRVPQRVTGWPLDLPGRGLSQAEFAGWRSRFRLGLEKEETAGWRQRRCAAKQDDAGNASTAPDQAGWLRRPRVHSAPPSTNARVQVGEGAASRLSSPLTPAPVKKPEEAHPVSKFEKERMEGPDPRGRTKKTAPRRTAESLPAREADPAPAPASLTACSGGARVSDTSAHVAPRLLPASVGMPRRARKRS